MILLKIHHTLDSNTDFDHRSDCTLCKDFPSSTFRRVRPCEQPFPRVAVLSQNILSGETTTRAYRFLVPTAPAYLLIMAIRIRFLLNFHHKKHAPNDCDPASNLLGATSAHPTPSQPSTIACTGWNEHCFKPATLMVHAPIRTN